MKTLTEIRQMLSDAYRQTTFFPRTNETYYPASWAYGEGAGDASTSTYYDRRRELAVKHVAARLRLVNFDYAITTLREAALDLFEAQNEREAQLVARETAANETTRGNEDE